MRRCVGWRVLGTFAVVAPLLGGCGSDSDTGEAAPADTGSTASDSTDGTDPAGTDATDADDATDATDATDGSDGADGTDASDGADASDGSDASDASDGTDATDGPAIAPELEGWCEVESTDFSFFVTSMNALWALSGHEISDWDGGLGGNYGGLEGADGICQKIATATGHGDKTWRAFLSVVDGGDGDPVHAIDRIGFGPWYDANGRLVATGIEGLLEDDRPDGDEESVDDLPDECGLPISLLGDAHDVITGSNKQGRLNSTDPNSTCNDWTTDDESVGVSGGGPMANNGIRCGHSFPRMTGGGGPGGGGPGGGGQHWLSDHSVPGCGKGAQLLQSSPSNAPPCIGCTGGYGAVYCFALIGP